MQNLTISKFARTLILGLFALGICSCASKEKVPHDPIKNEFMAYTQKFESVKEGDRYLGVATYLNPTMPEIRNEREDEFFLLTSYPKEIEIKNVRVNGSDENVSVELIADESELASKEVFKIAWSNRYKISAPKTQKDNLVLSFTTSNGLNASVKFRKVSKSMYWHPKLKLDD
ncbi:MAG: hypothetical protein J6M14_04830 [Campylobacter sp.]|nr:hypothetical protein [Campylobacter sp.]